MYLEQANSLALYLVVGAILFFILCMCTVFMIKSYRAGIAIGMDKRLLKRSITSSITFTAVPSISILLGVLALSGTLGIPLSWLRLSVIGALQYELNVAEIAATAIGLDGLRASEMSIQAFSTISLVMTTGILGGPLCCMLFSKKYLKKVRKTPKQVQTGKPSYSTVAVTAMFIGLCSAYMSSYIGTFVSTGDFSPLFTALFAAGAMAVFEYFTVVKKQAWLDNFSVATSMLLAMAAAVLIGGR